MWSGPHGFRASGAGALFQGIQSVDRDWIDRAVPEGQEVVVLWQTGLVDRFTVNQNEFFNRRVGKVYYTDSVTPGGINETPVSRTPGGGFPASRTGVFVLPNDGVVRAPYALLDASVIPDGVVVARDRTVGTTLWRLTGPLSSRATTRGLYLDGNWSGRHVEWRLVRCRPGTLTASVHSDPKLFKTKQTVVAVSGSRRAALRFSPAQAASPDKGVSLLIPVSPDGRGNCIVRFAVTPTANPGQVIPGSDDDRILGAHFDALTYRPR